MSKALFLALLVLASASNLPAQLADASADTQAKCAQYLNIPLPLEAATVTQPKAWPDCKSYKFYSGIGVKVDYAAASQCAWSERLAQQAGLEPQYTVASLFGGSAMLTVLYANGEGVSQDKPLALRFACESELSDSGLEDIRKLPTHAHLTAKKFRYCDEAMTTFAMNFCAAYDSEIAKQKRQDVLDALMRQWPQTDREAFAALQKSEDEYVMAHSRGEVYQGGTIRNLRMNGVEEHQRDEFLAAIQKFEKGDLPSGSKVGFQRADADLNATYKKALALASEQDFKDDDGLIQPSGIRDAERAWLKYRDAWVEFAMVHYPNSDTDAWLTLLTTNRFWSLRQTSCDVGWDDPACKTK